MIYATPTARIVSAYLSRHPVAPAQVAEMIGLVAASLAMATHVPAPPRQRLSLSDFEIVEDFV